MKLFATRPEKDRGRLSALGASALVHALVIALLLLGHRAVQLEPGTGGIGSGDGGGGGGGGGETVQYLAYVPPAAEPAPPETPVAPPPPEPVVPPPEIPPPTVAARDTVAHDSARVAAGDSVLGTAVSGNGSGVGTGIGPGTGSGTGGGNGSGTGTGDGSGTGPGSGGGDGTGGRSPSPRMLLLPPEAPSTLRGSSVTLELAVDDRGIVRDVKLRPPTGDAKFDATLRRNAREWRFTPGTDAGGRPVTKRFEVVFTF